MENIANKECGFEHEIVSYMYDELGARERTQFETHLVDCCACTDEFAAVSLSRFSVFEWQKEEFAQLSTPEIVIPYEAKNVDTEKPGWFAGLAEVFSFGRSPVTAGAVFAVVITLGFIGFSLIGTDAGEIASNVSVPTVAVDEKVAINSPLVEDNAAFDDYISPVKTASRDVRPKVARQSSPRRVVETRSTPNLNRQARRAPVLGDLADDDEDSLRLSDMLDGIGG